MNYYKSSQPVRKTQVKHNIPVRGNITENQNIDGGNNVSERNIIILITVQQHNVNTSQTYIAKT